MGDTPINAKKQETAKKTAMTSIVSTAVTTRKTTEMTTVVARTTAAITAIMILAAQESRRTIRSSRLQYSHQSRKSQRKM